MAKASTIITQLMLALPPLTNYFTDEISIVSLVRSGITVTATTSSPHGFITGDYITISGAKAPLVVTSLTRVGNVASGIVDLTTPHDLTENNEIHDKIDVTGADQTDYNVTNVTVLSAVNRFEFQYTVENEPVTPATGDILMWDGAERGYNGLFQIIVISPTTFTYTISGNFSDPYGTIIVRSGYRISGAIDLQRAEEVYTKQGTNKLWGFVVLGDTAISKNREVFTDAIAEVPIGGGYTQLELQRLSFFVFVPTINEIAARAARDLMEDIRIPLYQSLLRFQTQSGLTQNESFGIAAAGHRSAIYTKAYYVHEFEFEIANTITFDDTYVPDIDVAFRDVDLSNINLPIDPVNLEINLDDIPYEP